MSNSFATDRSARNLTLVKAEVDANNSGWFAVDYKVIVKKDGVQEMTAGGIVVPKDVKDQERWNVVCGALVDAGELAFTQGRKENGELYYWTRKPVMGTRVMFKEFAGVEFQGDDGETYVLLQDKDIGAIHE